MHMQSSRSWGIFWPAFFTQFFSVRPSFFPLSLLPLLTSDKALTLTTGLSLDRQNWGPFPYTSRGPLLLWESVWEWKRSGGVYARYGGRSVDGAKPDMTVEKQSRVQEVIEQWDKQLICVLVFGTLFKILFWLFLFCIFLFVHPPAFCSFLLPLGGSHLSSLIVKTPAFQWLSCTLAEL